MPKDRFIKLTRAVTPFVLLAILFLGGLYFVLVKTMDRIIADDAALGASGFSEFLISRPAELKRLKEGAGLSDAALQFYRTQAAAPSVVEVKLSGPDGRTVFAANSADVALRSTAKPALTSNVLAVPLGDGKQAWLRVVSDQSARRSHLDHDLYWALLALAFLTCCSFGVPAFVFLHEMAQRELSDAP